MIKFLLILATALILASAASAQTYQGCYPDPGNPRALPTELMVSGATIQTGATAAAAKGLAYFGLQYGGSAWGGNTVVGTKAAESNCNTPCTANAAQICGGAWYNSVYSTVTTGPTCPAGQFMTEENPFTCKPIMARMTPVQGSACTDGDSSFDITRSKTSVSAYFYLCDSTLRWLKAGPFTGTLW